jgi:cobalt-zinc-cadmium efflux system membrane fusion protein
MNQITTTRIVGALVCVVICSTLGCKGKSSDAKSEAPPAVSVQPDADPALVQVLNPATFPLVAAASYEAPATLNATGTVNPDVSRTIPVISIASGRVVAIHARLGDSVKKGQLLMEVQSNDVASAFSAYLKAVNDERLTQTQLDRSKLLHDKGAIPTTQLEIAQNAEDDAKSALTAAEQQLHVLGVDKDHPTETVKVYSPTSGIVVAQNVTDAAAAGVTYSGSANAFMIADLSRVWVVCDVYENDLAQVHLGEKAEVRLAAYPGKVLTGVISNIGAVLDPTLRTAKVRIEVANSGELMRVGMFATATFFGKATQTHASVPATAILHLHDRDWVYLPVDGTENFRRVAVEAGEMLPNGMQQVNSGIAIGQQVVSNALTLQNAVDQ